MSDDLQVGAIVLSTDCSYVALVRRSSSNLWGFPRITLVGKKHAEAAKQAVRVETGVALSETFHDVTFEAEEQPGVTARLYLATGLPVTELAPEKKCSTGAVQAAWFPLRQVFDSDSDGSGGLVAPFLADLHRYLNSNLDVFGNELATDSELTGEELAECMIYKRRSWNGVLPVSFLAQWAADRKLPSPCYDTVHNPRVLHMQCVTCILPHLGLQVTPDWGSVTTEDATQNAALAGIMFLAGAVGKDSPHFITTLVGSDPTVRPTPLDAHQAKSMLDHRLQLVQQQKAQAARVFEQRRKAWDTEVNVLEQQRKALSKGGPQADDVVKQIACWQADMPQTEQAAVQLPKGVMSFPMLKTRAASKANGFADRGSAKKKAQEDRPQAELQKAQAKNPIQELKEILDRHKWQQAEYSFHGQQDDGGHICEITVHDAGITGIVSQPCQNQRAAKASAASQALSQLVQQGMA